MSRVGLRKGATAVYVTSRCSILLNLRVKGFTLRRLGEQWAGGGIGLDFVSNMSELNSWCKQSRQESDQLLDQVERPHSLHVMHVECVLIAFLKAGARLRQQRLHRLGWATGGCLLRHLREPYARRDPCGGRWSRRTIHTHEPLPGEFQQCGGEGAVWRPGDHRRSHFDSPQELQELLKQRKSKKGCILDNPRP